MKKIAGMRLGLIALVSLLMACASGRKEQAAAPESDDLLELLTNFGESISKRNYNKAVDYLVPEEKALMVDGGLVSPEKQKMLSALPLQKLIRNPSVRVENGKIAGIYPLLPNLRQASAADIAVPPEPTPEDDALAAPNVEAGESGLSMNGEETPVGTPETSADSPASAHLLKATVNKFFAAVNRRNWQGALALMNESERRMLLDDKGRLKESAKQRLTHIDQQNRDALVLQDGKLIGVTLLLPSE